MAELFESGLRAVLLDAAGTLIRPSEPVGETYARLARRCGTELQADRLESAFSQVFGDMPELAFEWSSTAELQRQERAWWRTVVQRVIAKTASRIDEFETFFETVYEHYAQGGAWTCYPEVPAVLQSLRSRGCKLAVVSNFDSRLPGILHALGIDAYMDTVIYSSAAGSAKPDPAIFGRALAALDVTAGSAIHIGDSLRADFEGAIAAGLAGLLVRRSDAPVTASEQVIRSLDELLVRHKTDPSL